MKAQSLVLAAVFTAVSLGAGNARAGDKPKIERAAAEKVALARVPGGEIKEGELETEHGKLVWSFDIAQKTSVNITEVQVDANTGEVVAVEIETPDDQAHESHDKDEESKDHK